MREAVHGPLHTRASPATEALSGHCGNALHASCAEHQRTNPCGVFRSARHAEANDRFFHNYDLIRRPRRGRGIATVGVTARGNSAGRWSLRLLKEALNGEGAEFRVPFADFRCFLELI